MLSLLSHLAACQDLSPEQARNFFHFLTAPATADADRVALLAALRDKGETPDEVAAFADAMRSAALDPAIPRDDPRPILDIVGTGGDAAHTINISTAAALLAAAAMNGRIRVVKHGNRAISSLSGASDVLAALGLPAAMSPHVARALLDRTGFTYLHAPHYHPSVAAVASARKALGTRSIFNLLGPLTNPARPSAALIGAYSPRAATLMAHALHRLGVRSAVVVHTHVPPASGLDEATTTEHPFTEHHVTGDGVSTLNRAATDYRFPTCTLDNLRGKGPAHNARVIRDIFAGKPNPAADTIVLNTALALRTCAVGDIHACADAARAAIADGRAARLLTEIESFGREHATHAA